MKYFSEDKDLELRVETLPGQKKPSLLIGDELGYKKVAIFIKDEDAEDFIAHMDKFLKVNRKGR